MNKIWQVVQLCLLFPMICIFSAVNTTMQLLLVAFCVTDCSYYKHTIKSDFKRVISLTTSHKGTILTNNILVNS